MKLSYIGHACFRMETSMGTVVLFDPFQPGAFRGRIRLQPWYGPVDAVVSSHAHLDHRHIDPTFGAPQLITGPARVKGTRFDCIDLPHGAPEGRDHGSVTVFAARTDGLVLVHMGDAGRIPTEAEMTRLGRPDILLVPTGGRFTIGPREAFDLVRAWQPAIAVPMHYADPDVDIALEPLSAFLELAGDFERCGDTLELCGPLPGGRPRVIVMEHTRRT
jgi:L-ascorbate metabolism protein UlaG (beta-lactamase superfamily)